MAALLLSAIGCGPSEKAPLPAVQGVVCQSSSTDSPVFDSEIRIYHDATPSMRGFMTADVEPPYKKFLESIENAAKETLSPTVSLWQFGTIVEELPREKRLERATYTTRAGYENNDYRVVFRHAAPNSLTVIVTDLFQSDNDFAGVANDIQSRYFSSLGRGTAVAIIGDKLPFNGPIYDIGLAHAKVKSYEGPRPIYVMVFGSENQVLAYTNLLKAKLVQSRLDKDLNVLLFSRNLVSCLPALDLPLQAAAPPTNAKSIPQKGLFADHMDAVDELTEKQDPLVKQFLVRDDPAALTLDVPILPLPFVAPFKGEAFAVKYSAEKLAPGSPPQFQIAPEARDALEFKPLSFYGNCDAPCMMHLEASLQPRNLVAGDIYRFAARVEMVRAKAAGSTAPWVDEWSFSPPDFDGKKTENFAPFVSTLHNRMLTYDMPVLMRAYFYIKKR